MDTPGRYPDRQTKGHPIMPNKFDARVAELVAAGWRRKDADRQALAEERARAERVADETYRKGDR